MTVPVKTEHPPIETRDELVAYLEQGSKPSDAWRIGTEHEKFGFLNDTLAPIPYDGDRSVKAVLEGLRDQFGWNPVLENELLVALNCPGAAVSGSITLEPGGQFELSGAPLKTIHETCQEVGQHLDQVGAVSKELNIGFLGIGFTPKSTLQDTPVMPKGRYSIMRDYMLRTGNLGRDMMFRSATVQVNLDFASEADMVKKFRTSLALQPIATAIFANSPFTEGKPNGYLSYRSEIWRDTDQDRTGMLPFVFENGFGFERYVDYALDVPMYFVKRGDKYHNVVGASFRDFLEGRLEALPGMRPTMNDWIDHLTTLFPEVRMKQFLEMRGGDGGPWRSLCALPAFWVGLLYDSTALDAAWDLVKDWSAQQRQSLRDDVPRLALKAPIGNTSAGEIAKIVLEISRSGLKARNQQDAQGNTEVYFLNVLEEIVAQGRTPAEEMLAKFTSEWNGDIDHVFAEYAY
jgi:glutamate--cysteine ligase